METVKRHAPWLAVGVLGAFALALVSITLILYVALRRVSDVLMTLVPLLLAGVVTLELCVLLGLPLNFANIIALPVLLGVGVAFKIYYVLAWRDGRPVKLGDSLTVELEILEKLPKNRVRMATRVFNQAGKQVVDGEAEIMAPEEKLSVELAELPPISIG